MPIRRVCVFCGSSPGASPAYAEAARRLGQSLARRRLGLVYGGGAVGLMGILADEVLAEGGEVIGVIPRALYEREVGHDGVSRLEVVDDLFARKARMLELADAFVSLPGGVGTLDELFEVLTWVQLGYLAKPSGLLEVDGFWAPLLGLLDAQVEARFLRPEHRALLLHDDDSEQLLDRLAQWTPDAKDKWIDR